MSYHIDETATWQETVQALIKHGTMWTPAYDTSRKDFLGYVQRRMKKEPFEYLEDVELTILDETREQLGRPHSPYYLIQLKMPYSNNEKAKHLLDTKY